LADQIGLAVGEVGVAEAVVDIGGIGIGGDVELEQSDGGFDVSCSQRIVAEAIHDGFGEDDFLGIALAGFGEKLRGFGRTTRLIEKIEELVLVFGEDGSAHGGNDGMRAEGVAEPSDDVGGKILVQVEHFDTVAAFGEMFKLVDGVGGEAVNPFHEFDDAEIGIVIGDGGEEGENRMIAEELAARAGGAFGEKDEGFDFRMPAGEEDGLVDATTGAARSHTGGSDAGLRGEVGVGSVYVDGEFFVEDFLDLVVGEFVERSASAFAETAEIEGEDVDAGGGEFLGEVVPDFALAIALVEEEYAGAGLGDGEEGGFEMGAVGRGEIEDARGGELLGRGGESECGEEK